MASKAESPQAEGDLTLLYTFARVIAPRLHALHDPYVAVFQKEFLQSDSNRALLLRIAGDDAKRQQVAQNLLDRAKKSSTAVRLVGRIVMAAIVDPNCEGEKLAAIRRTTLVLRLLEENGFISGNQIEELAEDIRRRLPTSMEFLALPYMGASDQEGRLAKLYLALYEECEKFEHYGETGNFGLTMAAYGNLNRNIE
jgi:hypothetical protein